ncbi:eukaryotic translation initiation factor 3 subunit C-like [Paramacrobiotus metropolitanus]|uniref:eukaryotic translation initiation factor 3 subunit C-like n=1 Tax=Paramacrobiotus metropolitanus TaxID=2943436 RepID=UPI002446483B|nr:eukaryotic translation initiation factor 3 subunit C-like [Paramacrobiotus metropolitanus]
MSRFFASKDSESETESESSEDGPKVASKFQAYNLSDEEEESKRTLRSAKDKRFEEIQAVIKGLRNSKKIKDVNKVLEEFDQLTKVFSKSQKVIEKEGVPVFYIRCLVEMEDFVNQCWTDKNTLNKLNLKSLGSLRSKLRKYIKDYEDQMNKFRENPIASEEEAVDEAEDEDEEEEKSESEDESGDEDLKKKPVAGKKPARTADESGEDSDSDMWASDTDESSDESSDDERYKDDPAAKFRKKVTDKDDEKKKDKKDREKKTRPKREKVKVVGEDGFTMIVDKPKLFSKETEITHAVVLKKLSEIIAQRGKKATDRQEQIELIEELRVVARRSALGPAIEVKLIMSLVSSIFDYNPNVASFMKPDMWRRLLEAIADMVKFLRDHPEVDVGDHIPEDQEQYEVNGQPLQVHGMPLALVERMDEEFVKILQNCDAHSPEYVENLKSELKVCTIIDSMMNYLESKDAATTDLCRIYERRIAHTYYKIDYRFMDAEKKGNKITGETSLDLMDRLCTFIYNNDETDRIRTRAILMRVYHLALHNRWYDARDLMLMSKAQETIQLADPPTQVLYNRAMVQLGISAFRQGNVNEAHNALMDIQSSGRPKELLAQGLLPVRQHERSAEQEKIEKRRQIPFHMHINLDVLECVYLVSAMFIEVPYLAAHENDQRRRIISKYFYHSMKQSERHALSGPPETLPEYVIAASKAMKTGDWKKCRELILSEKLGKRVWDFFYEPDKIKAMLERKIQENSLRCFMYTNSAFYDSISVKTLETMFLLSKEDILSLIGKMVVSENLAASVDAPSQTVIMHRTEPSRVQQLSLQLADKLINLVENNERMLEMKNPTFQRQGKGGWQDRRQYRENREQRDQRQREAAEY